MKVLCLIKTNIQEVIHAWPLARRPDPALLGCHERRQRITAKPGERPRYPVTAQYYQADHGADDCQKRDAAYRSDRAKTRHAVIEARDHGIRKDGAGDIRKVPRPVRDRTSGFYRLIRDHL